MTFDSDKTSSFERWFVIVNLVVSVTVENGSAIFIHVCCIPPKGFPLDVLLSPLLCLLCSFSYGESEELVGLGLAVILNRYEGHCVQCGVSNYLVKNF